MNLFKRIDALKKSEKTLEILKRHLQQEFEAAQKEIDSGGNFHELSHRSDVLQEIMEFIDSCESGEAR